MILALGVHIPAAITVDQSAVYWVDANNESTPSGSVAKVSSAGGAVLGTISVLATGLSDPRSIAVNATSVFFATTADTLVVGSVAKGGGPTTPIATGTRDPNYVALDASYVYWTDPSQIQRAPLSGGPPSQIATFTAGGGPIALDSSSVYWSDGASLQKAPLAGGPATPVASVQQVAGLAVHNGQVYWTNGYDLVMSAAADGTSTKTLASSQDAPGDLVVDSSGVYWVNTGLSGTVMTLPLNGWQPLVLASSGQSNPVHIAVDANAVYWATGRGGTIMKIAKP